MRIKSTELHRDTAEILRYVRGGGTVVIEHYTEAIAVLSPAKEEYTVRNVISTNADIDVTKEYAEQVDELLDSAGPERETYQLDELDLKAYYTRLVTYAIDGTQRWTVDHLDPSSREVEEYDSREPAEARYEELVRDTARILGVDENGEQIQFNSTDVPGVPGYRVNPDV